MILLVKLKKKKYFTQMMNKYRKAISVIIKKDGKYLLVGTKGWNKNIWCFVQGGVEEGEEEIDAVIREIKEEVGVLKFNILGKSPIAHKYEFSEELQKKKRFLGQIQTIWFVEFLGGFDDVNISNGELQQYKWVKKNDILDHFQFPEQIETFRKVLENEEISNP